MAAMNPQTQTQPNPTQTDQQTNNEIDYYYDKFNGNHLTGSEPKQKSFQNGKITYKEIALQYNYGNPESPIIDSCFFELPIVSSYGGIVEKRETKPALKEGDPPYIKESYSMMFSFNLQDQECITCLQKLDELHLASARVLGQYKGKVGFYDFDPERPGNTLKNPVYYKRDEVTGERVAGTNPSMWVKMNHWRNNKTLFTDLNETPIDWSLLKDVEIKMIPLVHVEKIYVGSKASLQLKLVSAVITDIAPINTRTRQTRTIDRLKKRAGLADQVASQLAQLRMDKQDSLDDGQQHPSVAHLPSDSGSMHTIPSSSGTIQGTQESLNDYLGGAPTMSQTPPQSHQHFQTQAPVQQIPQRQTSQPQLPQQPAVPQLPQSQVPQQPSGQVQFNPVTTQTQPAQTVLSIQ